MKNNIVKYGLIAGVGVIAYFLLFYFIDTKVMFSPYVNWGSVLIYLVFMFVACIQERKMRDEIYPFNQALRTAFGVFVITNLIYYIFNYILFNLDPTLLITQKEVVIENMQWVGRLTNAEVAPEEIQKLRSEYRPVTFANSLFAFTYSLIGGFGLSLLVAALARR